MRLVMAPDQEERVKNGTVSWPHSYRLYDDSGNPMQYVKSVSFCVDPSEGEPVIMVIERYVLQTDEVDIEVPDEFIREVSVSDEDLSPTDKIS